MLRIGPCWSHLGVVNSFRRCCSAGNGGEKVAQRHLKIEKCLKMLICSFYGSYCWLKVCFCWDLVLLRWFLTRFLLFVLFNCLIRGFRLLFNRYERFWAEYWLTYYFHFAKFSHMTFCVDSTKYMTRVQCFGICVACRTCFGTYFGLRSKSFLVWGSELALLVSLPLCFRLQLKSSICWGSGSWVKRGWQRYLDRWVRGIVALLFHRKSWTSLCLIKSQGCLKEFVLRCGSSISDSESPQDQSTVHIQSIAFCLAFLLHSSHHFPRLLHQLRCLDYCWDGWCLHQCSWHLRRLGNAGTSRYHDWYMG